VKPYQLLKPAKRKLGLYVVVPVLLMVMAPVWALGGPVEDYEKGVELYNGGDLNAGMSALRKSAKAGYAPAQAYLGYLLDYAEFDDEAVLMYEAAAEQEHPAGEYGLGEMYTKGEGVEKDGDMAIYWFTKAAEQGHVQAIQSLIGIYKNGAFGFDPDPKQMTYWTEKLEAIKKTEAQGKEKKKSADDKNKKKK